MHVSEDHITQLESALAAAEPLVLLPPLHPRYIQSLLARWVERQGLRQARLVEPYRGSRTILADRIDPGSGVDRGDDLGTWLDGAELPSGEGDRWQRVWWIPDLADAWSDPRTCAVFTSICREVSTQDLHLRILVRTPTAPLPAPIKAWARSVELLAPKAREGDADSFAIDVLDGAAAQASRGHHHLNERLAAFEAEGTPARTELSMLLQGLDAAAVNVVIEAVARWLGSRSEAAGAPDWSTIRARLEKEREGQLKQASGLTIERKNDETLEGMPRFQRYLEYVSVLFHDHRFERKVGGPTPRGVLLVGLPGCGKSLAARVTAEKLDVPLLRMDVGAMMGRYLGESEANLQRALDAAEAAAPCVLWVDELEKALGGMGKAGGEGGGTGTRMLGQLLTWMQGHTSSVYLFATANAVKSLPPELLRRGRFDELWRVMLPEDDERDPILRAKLQELGSECHPDLLADDSPQRAALVKSTKGYTGADIGSLVREAWMRARVFEEKVTAERLEAVQKGDFQPMSAQFSTEIKKSITELEQHGFRNVWCPPDKLDPPPPSDRMAQGGRLRGVLAELWRTSEPVLAVFKSATGKTWTMVVDPGEGSSRSAAMAQKTRTWDEWRLASRGKITLERDGRTVAVRGLTKGKEETPVSAQLCWVGEEPGALQLEVDGTVYVLEGSPRPELKWEEFSVGGEGFRLRRVAAGTYTVGSRDDDEDAADDEKPRHLVRFSRAVGVGEFAVTQGLYEAVMGTNPSHFSGKSDSARRPVERVSWLDAVAFCNRLSERCGLAPAYRIDGKDVERRAGSPGFRLPTEHEWEVAARAGTDLKYAGSDELAAVGWFRDNSGRETHPVGQKAPNGWGLYDLSGNVWEWCWDWFDSGAYQRGTMADPVGPQSGAGRVPRGGCWNDGASDARVAYRDYSGPSLRDDRLGFRLTRTLP